MGVKYGPRLTLVLFAGAIVSFPLPARAGAVSYPDPAGDATAVGNAQPPRPSDPELDLLHVYWSTTSEELVVTTSLAALGGPVASDGWAVAHYLDYEGIAFEVLIQDVGQATATAFGPDGVYLRLAGDPLTEFGCVCRFTASPAQSTVTVRVELHSLGSAAKWVDPSLRRPAPGSQFTELQTTSYRVAGVLLASDRAAAPEGATLVV